MRSVWIVLAAALSVATLVVATRDPEEAWAVAAVIIALGVAAGAAALLLQLRPIAPRAGRRRARPRIDLAVRRACEVSVMVALLLWLRAVDGLSVITAAFIVLAFVAAEAILSARPDPAR